MVVNIRPARGLQATALFNSETSCSSRCEKVCSPCPKSAICLLMSLTCLTLRCGMALPTERSVIQMGFTGTGFDLALADCKDCEHGCHKLPRSTPKFKAVITPTFHHGTAPHSELHQTVGLVHVPIWKRSYAFRIRLLTSRVALATLPVPERLVDLACKAQAKALQECSIC